MVNDFLGWREGLEPSVLGPFGPVCRGMSLECTVWIWGIVELEADYRVMGAAGPFIVFGLHADLQGPSCISQCNVNSAPWIPGPVINHAGLWV